MWFHNAKTETLQQIPSRFFQVVAEAIDAFDAARMQVVIRRFRPGPHTVHCHTMHLPLGALLFPCTVCGTVTLPLPLPHLPHRFRRKILEGRERAPTDSAIGS